MVSFSDEIPRRLGTWQYRHYTLEEAMPLQAAFRAAAMAETASGTDEVDRGDRPGASSEELRRKMAEIEDLNGDLIPRYTRAAQGPSSSCPVARRIAWRRRRPWRSSLRSCSAMRSAASTLLEMNEDRISPLKELPAGVALRVPQRDWPAVAAFSVLVAVLLAVGMGWLLRVPAAAEGAVEGSSPPAA